MITPTSSAATNPYAALNPSQATSKSAGDSAFTLAPPASSSQSEVDQFQAYAKMTPAERMRASILSSMGLTEDDLKAMTPDQRQAVEQKIEKMIQDAAMQAAEKKSTGLLADVKV
jgi:hypothetical protein